MSLINWVCNSLSNGIVQAHNVNSFILRDLSPGNKCNPTTVTASNPFSVLKLDNLISAGTLDLFPFFLNNPGIKRCADYVILYYKNGIYWVLISELKSNNSSGCESQLDAGYTLSLVLINTAQRVLNQKFAIKYKGVLFSNRIDKIYNNNDAPSSTLLQLNYYKRYCGVEFNLDAHAS